MSRFSNSYIVIIGSSYFYIEDFYKYELYRCLYDY